MSLLDYTNDILPALGGTVSTADQSLLVNLVQPMAERLVKKEVGYNIEQATHTEYLPQRDEHRLRDSLVEKS